MDKSRGPSKNKYKMLLIGLTAYIVVVVPFCARAQPLQYGPPDNYDVFAGFVAIEGFQAHAEIILTLTKSGWSIISGNIYTDIKFSANGRDVMAYPEAHYIMKNENTGAFAICRTNGHSLFGSGIDPSYRIYCQK